MNSKRKSMRKLGHVVQILVCRLTLVNMMLNLSNVHTLPNNFNFATKIILDRASVHTQKPLPLPDAPPARTVQSEYFFSSK